MTDITTLTAEELADLLGPDASGWLDLGLTVTRGSTRHTDAADEVTVHHDGMVVGYTGKSPEFPGMRVYYAVITEGRAVPFPAGFIPADPLRAQHGERARWLPLDHPDRPVTATHPTHIHETP